MIKNVLMTALFLAGFLSSCGSQNSVTVNGEKMQLEDGVYAHFSTTQGDILVELNTELAPLTAANFAALAEGTHPLAKEEFKGKPFYDGLIFHRVIPNFMIQGGDPQGTGMGGPGYKFANETSDSLPHDKGVISMANSGPNTNGSQFFITVASTPQLNGGYSVFGKVVAGQAVADSISEVATNKSDRPEEDVVMETVKIIRVGKEAKKYDPAAAFTAAQEGILAAQKEKEAAMRAKVKELTAEADSTASGLYYQVLEEGDGPKPEEGQQVLMNYAGYLLDGKIFDTNIESIAKEEGIYDARRQYQPFPIPASRNAQVIMGWREALVMMNVGDKWRLIISPELGYGERGAGNVIPPNAWLIFDVEMTALADQGAE